MDGMRARARTRRELMGEMSGCAGQEGLQSGHRQAGGCGAGWKRSLGGVHSHLDRGRLGQGAGCGWAGGLPGVRPFPRMCPHASSSTAGRLKVQYSAERILHSYVYLLFSTWGCFHFSASRFFIHYSSLLHVHFFSLLLVHVFSRLHVHYFSLFHVHFFSFLRLHYFYLHYFLQMLARELPFYIPYLYR